jgi:signal transduction histidine kinase
VSNEWVRRGALSAPRGLALALLSLLNLPLLALSVVALALVGIGLGVWLFPPVMTAVRGVANLHRRLAGRWSGVEIARPYRPRPPDGAARRFRWVLSDPATWRDLLWLLLQAPVGVALGVVTPALVLYGAAGVLLVPLLIYMIAGISGYGFVWPVDNPLEGGLALPQGALFLLLALTVGPRLLWLDALFARWLLAPTRTARLTQRVHDLTESRSDTVDAQAAELRRIERDLHDGTQARLVALSMSIGLARELMGHDPAAARELLAEAHDASGQVLTELRHLVRGIHPPALAERGLDGAVRALALAVPLPVAVDIDLPGRPQAPVESAVYFAVAEALANLTKHSGAADASIQLSHVGGVLTAVVTDDGVGGADPARGTGLRGIQRRLGAFDGTLVVTSPSGGPTVVTMELPCELSSPKTMPSSAMG